MRRWSIYAGLMLGIALGAGAAAPASASTLCPWDGHGWFAAAAAGEDVVAVLAEGGLDPASGDICAAEVDDALLIARRVDDDLWRYPTPGRCARGFYIAQPRDDELAGEWHPFDANRNGVVCAKRFVPLPVGPGTRLVSEYADDASCSSAACGVFDELAGQPARWSDGDLTGWNTSGSAAQASLTAVRLASGLWAAELANTGATAGTCTLNDSPNVVKTTAGTGTYMYRLFVEPETSGQTLRLRVREYRGTSRVASRTSDVRLWPRGRGAAVMTYTPVAPGESTLDFNASVVNAAPGRCFRATALHVLIGAMPPPPDPGPNLLTNDGFEFDRSGWNTTYSGAGVALTRAFGGHTGHWAAKLTNTGTSAARCTLNDSPNAVATTASGDMTYYASLWVRADTPGRTLRLLLREWGPSASAVSAREVTLTTEWQRVQTVARAAWPSRSTLELNATVADAPPGTCFYADDASVVAIPGPPQGEHLE